MEPKSYLPSAQFAVMAGALLLAGGLVVGAQYITTPKPLGSISATPTNPTGFDADWEQTLEQIQLESGITAPAAPSQTVVDELLTAAQSSNLTSTIGRTLLVNLSAANAQGLGTDAPTQDSLIEAAAAQVGTGIKASYTIHSLTVIEQSPETLRAYGNALATVMASHPGAQAGVVLLAFGEALDYQNAAKLAGVRAGQQAYAALAASVAATPVPETLAPLHLQLANRLANMGDALGEMTQVLDDPLRGLGGLQIFQSSGDEAARLLTTIAQNLNNNGILFSKDEPGSAWGALVAQPLTP